MKAAGLWEKILFCRNRKATTGLEDGDTGREEYDVDEALHALLEIRNEPVLRLE